MKTPEQPDMIASPITNPEILQPEISMLPEESGRLRKFMNSKFAKFGLAASVLAGAQAAESTPMGEPFGIEAESAEAVTYPDCEFVVETNFYFFGNYYSSQEEYQASKNAIDETYIAFISDLIYIPGFNLIIAGAGQTVVPYGPDGTVSYQLTRESTGQLVKTVNATEPDFCNETTTTPPTTTPPPPPTTKPPTTTPPTTTPPPPPTTKPSTTTSPPTTTAPTTTTRELLADTDGDGIPDAVEEIIGSDPNSDNTDGDSKLDGEEVGDEFLGIMPIYIDELEDLDASTITDQLKDTDSDGKPDIIESDIEDVDGDGSVDEHDEDDNTPLTETTTEPITTTAQTSTNSTEQSVVPSTAEVKAATVEAPTTTATTTAEDVSINAAGSSEKNSGTSVNTNVAVGGLGALIIAAGLTGVAIKRQRTAKANSLSRPPKTLW